MTTRPSPFAEYTTPEFWNDPHISAQMLAFHLDPDLAPASRPHDFIDRSAAWILATFELVSGSRVLDLGCGPGLYAQRLARAGAVVRGIDVSARSLDHARSVAAREGLPATFVEGNYLEADLGRDHDLALMIYEDYCALSPAQRSRVLERVRDALRPGGAFVFDVTAASRFDSFVEGSVTELGLMGGFWAPTPYVGTQETWIYPEHRLALEKYTIDREGERREFWNWTHCLLPEQVGQELARAGLILDALLGDVAGAAYDPESPTFAVIARREVRP